MLIYNLKCGNGCLSLWGALFFELSLEPDRLVPGEQRAVLQGDVKVCGECAEYVQAAGGAAGVCRISF